MFPGVALVTGAASGEQPNPPKRNTTATTDASTGIGQATAVSFAKEGCSKVVLADRNQNGLDETASIIKDAAATCETICVQTDVSNADSVQHLVDEAVRRFERIDYVCNAAGISPVRRSV